MIYDLQKANPWKRISAFLLDIIAYFIVFAGAAALISLLVGYDAKLDELEALYVKYGDEYDINLEISDEEFSKLSPNELKKYEDASNAFKNDASVVAVYSTVYALSALIISLSAFIPFIILEFIIPISLKNGQTIGKKIFGIALIRPDCVRISTFQLFVRAILGKYTIETMIPLFIAAMLLIGALGLLGLIVLGLILVLQIVVIVVSKTNSPIHDLLAVTVAVDINSQRVFNSTQELLEYKQKKAQEAAIKAPY